MSVSVCVCVSVCASVCFAFHLLLLWVFCLLACLLCFLLCFATGFVFPFLFFTDFCLLLFFFFLLSFFAAANSQCAFTGVKAKKGGKKKERKKERKNATATATKSGNNMHRLSSWTVHDNKSHGISAQHPPPTPAPPTTAQTHEFSANGVGWIVPACTLFFLFLFWQLAKKKKKKRKKNSQPKQCGPCACQGGLETSKDMANWRTQPPIHRKQMYDSLWIQCTLWCLVCVVGFLGPWFVALAHS